MCLINRRRSLACAALLVAATLAGPSAAGAVVVHEHGHHFLGVAARLRHSALPGSTGVLSPMRTTTRGATAANADVADPFPLPTSYQTLIDQFFRDVQTAASAAATDNVYGVSDQYGASPTATNGANQYSASFGGDLSNTSGGTRDTDPYPADGLHGNDQGCDPAQSTLGASDPPYVWCLTDAQIQTELNKLVAAGGLPADSSAVYFIFLPPGVDACYSPGPETAGVGGNPCADTDFCAYHSSEGMTSGPLYAVMPWADISGCQSGNHPNGDPADDTIDVTSHEHIESITDPFATSWISAQGNEIGDLCAAPDVFGSPLGGSPGNPSNPGTAYNQVIGAGHYYLQDEFADINQSGVQMTKNCVQRPTTAVKGDGYGNSSTDPGPLINPQGGPVLGHHTVYSVYWYPGARSSPPTAAFAKSAAVARPGDAVSFNASASTDPQGEPLTYSWDFGDGTSGSGVAPTHAYSVPGDHTVTLSVSDADGFSATTSQALHVFTPPAAAFTGPSGTAYTHQPLSFDASASGGPEAPITSYAWTFGDGATGGGARMAHAYAAPGVYTVTLTVTDAHGISTSASQQFTLSSPPSAHFSTAGSPRATPVGGGVLVLVGRKVACPLGPAPCTTTVGLTTRVTTRASRGHRSRARTYTIGAARVTTAAGQTSVLSAQLNAQGRSLLLRLGRLRVTAQIGVTGAVLSPTSSRFSFSIKQPGKARRRA